MTWLADLARAARAESSGSGSANEINWPIPISGLYGNKGGAEVRSVLAETFEDLESDGSSVYTRPGYQDSGRITAGIQRIPFEFGQQAHYVNVSFDRLTAQGSGSLVSYARLISSPVSYSSISSRLVIATGNGAPLLYDGSSFLEAEFSTPTGVDPAQFDGVVGHHDRLFFFRTDGPLEFYYGGLGAITGELQRFPLDRLGTISGSISLMASVTLGAQEDQTDVLMILTSTGQMVIYEGLDPGDASNWRLWGRATVGVPVNKNAFTKMGPDLLILTTGGLISVAAAMTSAEMAFQTAYTTAVYDDIKKAISQAEDVEEWRVWSTPEADRIIICSPKDSGYGQYVFNIKSQSWAKWNLPAVDFHSLLKISEFSHSDGSCKRISEDIEGDDGLPVTSIYHSTWVRLPRSSDFVYLVPTIEARGPLSIKVTVLNDHNSTAQHIAMAEQEYVFEPEDETEVSALQTIDEIIGVGSVGRVFQLRLEVTAAYVNIVNLVVGVA